MSYFSSKLHVRYLFFFHSLLGNPFLPACATCTNPCGETTTCGTLGGCNMDSSSRVLGWHWSRHSLFGELSSPKRWSQIRCVRRPAVFVTASMLVPFCISIESLPYHDYPPALVHLRGWSSCSCRQCSQPSSPPSHSCGEHCRHTASQTRGIKSHITTALIVLHLLSLQYDTDSTNGSVCVTEQCQIHYVHVVHWAVKVDSQ